MSYIVYKYSLPHTRNLLSLPQSAKILDVRLQDRGGDKPCFVLWAQIDQTENLAHELREIICLMTGEPHPYENLEHIATQETPGGLVYHFFENTGMRRILSRSEFEAMQ